MEHEPGQTESKSRLIKGIQVFHVEGVNAPILNISQGGFAIKTRVPLSIGKIYTFRLKYKGHYLLLAGEVVRCHLSDLVAVNDGSQQPIYENGIEFHYDRNPKELMLLAILKDNLSEDRRLDTIRIKPVNDLRVDIGGNLFEGVVQLSLEQIVLEATNLLDMDEKWWLLLTYGEESLVLKTRILQASKRRQNLNYQMHMEYLDLGEEEREILTKIVALLSQKP